MRFLLPLLKFEKEFERFQVITYIDYCSPQNAIIIHLFRNFELLNYFEPHSIRDYAQIHSKTLWEIEYSPIIIGICWQP